MNKRGRLALVQIIILVIGFVGVAWVVGGGVGVVEAAAKTTKAAVTSSAVLLPQSGYVSNFIGTGYKEGFLFPNGKVYATEKVKGVSGKGVAIEGKWREAGSSVDALASGLEWAGIAYMAGTMLGDMFGMTGGNSKALGTSMAAGFGAYKALSVYGQKGMFASGKGLSWLGKEPEMAGIGIGVLIFSMMYKKVKTEVVTFSCMPWQAPSGGDNCQVCNDAKLPCSEYRCKSLGQSCEIVNAGSADEKCVYVNPRDVTPPTIKPNYAELTKGYTYKNVKNSPPGPGFKIANSASGNGCLKAFSPLKFGITTDEPSQCKISFNHTTKFSAMSVYVGGSNLYAYNHTEKFSLPGSSELGKSGFALENGKDMTFYLRCKDKNGNENEAEYAVNFCIDPSPDTTPPEIETTSVINGACVSENTTKTPVTFYTNEPATCKWSTNDKDYNLMENNMTCDDSYTQVNAAQLFGCKAELTGIPRGGTDYYVRCKDQPNKPEKDRNVNRQSFKFRLRGSTGLVLKTLRPNESVFGGVSPMPVELYAETLFGCNDGESVCEFSSDGKHYIRFFDTNNKDGVSTQNLNLNGGKQTYFVRCTDAGGNVVKSVAKFNVTIDSSAPTIARVYKEGSMLKVVTVRDSQCAYSLDNCDFGFSDGINMPRGNTTTHVTDWNEKNTYYIKCRDKYLNENAGCSIVVRPTKNFL